MGGGACGLVPRPLTLLWCLVLLVPCRSGCGVPCISKSSRAFLPNFKFLLLVLVTATRKVTNIHRSLLGRDLRQSSALFRAGFE